MFMRKPINSTRPNRRAFIRGMENDFQLTCVVFGEENISIAHLRDAISMEEVEIARKYA